MRVLVVAPTLPWPLDAGGRIRTFQLLRQLCASHEIELWCVRQPDANAEHAAALSTLGLGLRVFERSARPLLQRLQGPRAESWFHSAALRESLAQIDASHSFDLIHLDELCLARALPQTTALPVLVHHHKLDLELSAAVDGESARAQLEARRWRELEREAVTLTRRHVFCSDLDAQIFQARHPSVAASVVENGVDELEFAAQNTPRDVDHLLALGSLDYEPNVRGLEEFLRIAWPRIANARRALRLSIVGRGADVRRFGNLPVGVQLVGAARDVRPWLARTTALVVPLAIGGGTRLKIVEAAALGCPVISTQVGAEGLDFADEAHMTLAASIHELAHAVERALASPRSLQVRANAARERVLAAYTWRALAERMSRTWEACAQPVKS